MVILKQSKKLTFHQKIKTGCTGRKTHPVQLATSLNCFKKNHLRIIVDEYGASVSKITLGIFEVREYRVSYVVIFYFSGGRYS